MVAVGDHAESGSGRETGLRVEVSDQAGWSVVAFEGELDLEELEMAAGALDSALGRASRGVVADLTRISFLGSTGMRALLEARTRATDAGLGFRVVQGRGPARRLIEMLGLEQRLDVIDVD